MRIDISFMIIDIGFVIIDIGFGILFFHSQYSEYMVIIERLKLNWLFFKGMKLRVRMSDKICVWWREAFGPSLKNLIFLAHSTGIAQPCVTIVSLLWPAFDVELVNDLLPVGVPSGQLVQLCLQKRDLGLAVLFPRVLLVAYWKLISKLQLLT